VLIDTVQFASQRMAPGGADALFEQLSDVES
jgi:hypothetical protein